MALKDLIPQPVTIKAGSGTLTINPLTLKDIIQLSQTYYPELSGLMEGGVANIASLILKSPIFAATIIAYACGEPDNFSDAAKLPFSVQLIALKTIWEASMVDEEQVGKFLVGLSGGLQRMNALLKVEAEKQKLGTTASLGLSAG